MSKDKKSAADIDNSELERIEKERKKKREESLKKLKAKEKKEQKRVNRLIKFPFKTLFQVSILSGLISFLIFHFGREVDLLKSLYSSSIVAIAILLGIGLIMAVIFVIISDKREKELLLEIEEEKERQKMEDEKRAAELKNMEEEIRISEKQLKESFPIGEESYDMSEDLMNESPLSLPQNNSAGDMPMMQDDEMNLEDEFMN